MTFNTALFKTSLFPAYVGQALVPQEREGGSHPVLTSGPVSLKFNNLLGNEVQTLVDEYKNANDYEVKWDTENLPGGIYFYRLKTESFVESKKMVLQK